MKFKELFELEKKSDGLYRCKGGHIADILFLTWGILYCFLSGIAIFIKICFCVRKK